MKYTNEQISKIYKSLPLDIREVIASVEYMDSVQAIGKKYKLLIDKVGVLSEETGFVLMGITLSKDFAKNIRERLEVSEDVAINIVKEINEQIFSVVRESLKKIYEERAGEDSSLLEENEKDGGSLLAGSVLGKTEEKAGEEELNREDILRDIEDGEHHNLPMINKSELHLETKRPSEVEIVEKPVDADGNQGNQTAFQNAESNTNAVIINPTKYQSPQKPSVPREDIVRTMEKDIFKTKMGGTVSVPKETIVINDSVPQPKTKQPSMDKKVDPYREIF